MQVNRVIISVIGLVIVLGLGWHGRASADVVSQMQPAVLKKAERALQKDDPAKAVALLSEWSETASRPDYRSDAHGLLCRAHYQLGDFERAEAACSAAMEEGDSLLTWSHLNNRGVMRLAQGQIDAAIEDFLAANRINPRASSVRQNLAVAERLKRSQPLNTAAS